MTYVNPQSNTEETLSTQKMSDLSQLCQSWQSKIYSVSYQHWTLANILLLKQERHDQKLNQHGHEEVISLQNWLFGKSDAVDWHTVYG